MDAGVNEESPSGAVYRAFNKHDTCDNQFIAADKLGDVLAELKLPVDVLVAAALKLPFVRRSDGQAATPAEITADFRAVLAQPLGKLAGSYRKFTLLDLQKVVEALLGQPLHKQNFRRSLDRSELVVGLGQFTQATGGRPAELFRFRREALREGHVSGVQTPRG